MGSVYLFRHTRVIQKMKTHIKTFRTSETLTLSRATKNLIATVLSSRAHACFERDWHEQNANAYATQESLMSQRS